MFHRLFGHLDTETFQEVQDITGKNRIGRGMYSRAYAWGTWVYVLSKDPAKEALALFSDKDNPHNPKVERLTITDRGTLYKIPRYRNLRHMSKDNRELLRELLRISEDVRRDRPTHGPIPIVEQSQLPDMAKACVIDMVEAYGNYVDPATIRLDCCGGNPNCVQDDAGTLIFLDILHDTEKWNNREQYCLDKYARFPIG